MLAKGNRKLGREFWSFGLPAVSTCPGSSELCRSKCYALKGHYRFANVRNSLVRNYRRSLRPTFVDRMVEAITSKKVTKFRISTSGDFYSAEYVRKWIDIARRCPQTVFLAYTRSWRVKGFARALRRLAALPNFRLWYSADRDTGLPEVTPPGVRVCYLADSDADARDIDPAVVRLVFRDVPDRRTELLSVNGRPVCPVENGRHSHLTCEKCKLCLRPACDAPASGRRPLALV